MMAEKESIVLIADRRTVLFPPLMPYPIIQAKDPGVPCGYWNRSARPTMALVYPRLGKSATRAAGPIMALVHLLLGEMRGKSRQPWAAPFPQDKDTVPLVQPLLWRGVGHHLHGRNKVWQAFQLYR